MQFLDHMDTLHVILRACEGLVLLSLMIACLAISYLFQDKQ